MPGDPIARGPELLRLKNYIADFSSTFCFFIWAWKRRLPDGSKITSRTHFGEWSKRTVGNSIMLAPPKNHPKKQQKCEGFVQKS